MNLLDQLERKFGRFFIPNLTMLLVFGQAIFFLLNLTQSITLSHMLLIPSLVLQGEVWRLLTFPFVPPPTSLLFFFFGLYFFYLMGTALESYWGEFRFNLYLLIGYLATLAVAFLSPDMTASNVFIAGSVFLAFAYLNPNFEVLLFFILPVRIKWLAMVTGGFYLLGFVSGSWGMRLSILASLGNFLVFFGPDLLFRIRSGERRMRWQSQTVSSRSAEAFHRCVICGKTDQSHPEMTFRYCGQCDDAPGYCEEHLENHEHIRKVAAPLGPSGTSSSS